MIKDEGILNEVLEVYEFPIVMICAPAVHLQLMHQYAALWLFGNMIHHKRHNISDLHVLLIFSITKREKKLLP